jgi:putative ABC transport system permease protein
VPALLRGGSSGLRDGPNLRWEDASVPLDVVGTAPDVDASVDPVLVVDAESIAAAGVVAPPDTVWAVGPGAADALRAVAPGVAGSDPVVTYADELDTRRDASLPSAVVALAAASGALLMLLALLGTVLAAAADAPARGSSCGRLRALGLANRDLRRVLTGELVVPVGVSGLVGLGVGVVCAHAALGSLALERLTGAPGSPEPVVPWWTVVLVVVLVACAAALSVLEWQRTRRTPLAQLLRT